MLKYLGLKVVKSQATWSQLHTPIMCDYQNMDYFIYFHHKISNISVQFMKFISVVQSYGFLIANILKNIAHAVHKFFPISVKGRASFLNTK